MTVGDEEREHVVAALRQQFADGKLTLEEFGDRVEAAYAAVTIDDLQGSVRDLPIPVNPSVPQPAAYFPEQSDMPVAPTATAGLPARPAGAKKGFYSHLGPYVVVNAFLVMIYLITDLGGYFWPIWPMMGWGVAVGIHAWAVFVSPQD